MKAVIMAGGLGKRLRPLTQIIPKPLLPVGDRSVLEIQIHNLKEHGVDTIFLALGYRHELFQAYFGDGSNWGVRIFYSVESKPLGTAGPLSLLRDKLDEPFLVMNGDILTNLDCTRLAGSHLETGADITVVTKIVTFPLRYGVIEHKDNRVYDIREKPSLTAEINAGIYFMNPEVIDGLPADTAVSMDDLLRTMIADNHRVSRFLLSDYWLDIGQEADYQMANDMVSQNGPGKDGPAWQARPWQ
ncbi:MAG: NTP transferase domain-containing protein [Desulfohalobiaceae bacterium]|nr:NTP transferase domain-containing protein [Desulfohalobiaceae bacterium]